LFRLFTFQRLRTRYAARNDMPISRLRLMKLMITLTLSFHWVACLCGFLLTIERQNGWCAGNTWADALRSAKPGLFVHPTRDTPFELYTASLYWSAMTVTSIGYGDITPNNVYEAWLAVLVMAFTGLVWAHIIGGICAICTSLDIEAIDLETKLDSLNVVLRVLEVPTATRMVCRELFRSRKSLFHKEKHVELMWAMSPGYQAEVARCIEHQIVRHVWYFKGTTDAFVVGLCQAFQLDVYPPQEIIRLSQTLVSVDEGVAMSGCRMLVRSDAWGISDVLLTNAALFENKTPISLSYLHVQFLTHHNLVQLTEIHPEERRRLRVAAIKIAICRGMINRLISPLTPAEQFQQRVKREQICKESDHSVESKMLWRGCGALPLSDNPETSRTQAVAIEDQFLKIMALLRESVSTKSSMLPLRTCL